MGFYTWKEALLKRAHHQPMSSKVGAYIEDVSIFTRMTRKAAKCTDHHFCKREQSNVEFPVSCAVLVWLPKTVYKRWL